MPADAGIASRLQSDALGLAWLRWTTGGSTSVRMSNARSFTTIGSLPLVALFLIGCYSSSRFAPRPNPDAETLRSRMGLLRKGMSRQEAEAVLGLTTSRTNLEMIWTYSLPADRSACLWFDSSYGSGPDRHDITMPGLLCATLDFHSVTSGIPNLRLGMSVAEVEAALGIQYTLSWGGTSSGVSLAYTVYDPEHPGTNGPCHQLSVRFATPFQKPSSEVETWVRANGSLAWLWLDGQPIDPPKTRKP